MIHLRYLTPDAGQCARQYPTSDIAIQSTNYAGPVSWPGVFNPAHSKQAIHSSSSRTCWNPTLSSTPIAACMVSRRRCPPPWSVITAETSTTTRARELVKQRHVHCETAARVEAASGPVLIARRGIMLYQLPIRYPPSQGVAQRHGRAGVLARLMLFLKVGGTNGGLIRGPAIQGNPQKRHLSGLRNLRHEKNVRSRRT